MCGKLIKDMKQIWLKRARPILIAYWQEIIKVNMKKKKVKKLIIEEIQDES
jgi:hypothetical protein